MRACSTNKSILFKVLIKKFLCDLIILFIWIIDDLTNRIFQVLIDIVFVTQKLFKNILNIK